MTSPLRTMIRDLHRRRGRERRGLALAEGVRLVGLQAKSGATLPLLAIVGECSLPPLARRAGPSATTAMVEILHDGQPVRRVAVQVRLLLSEQAAREQVPRGSVITLVIQRASATVSAQGIALQDAEIGQTAPFKVQPFKSSRFRIRR